MEKIYMLDTVIFNRALDNPNIYSMLSTLELRATHVQIDEINQTTDLVRRQELLSVFKALNPIKIRTSNFVWDVSRWDGASWGERDNLYSEMLRELKQADAKSKKTKSEKNQHRNILIAETAIRNAFVLVTQDKNLFSVAQDFGGLVTTLDQLPRPEP